MSKPVTVMMNSAAGAVLCAMYDKSSSFRHRHPVDYLHTVLPTVDSFTITRVSKHGSPWDAVCVLKSELVCNFEKQRLGWVQLPMGKYCLCA